MECFNLFKFIVETLLTIGTVSIAAIAYYQSKKASKKEYQIYEDLKYQIMQVIAAVRSLDAKAAVALDIQKEGNHIHKPDYSLEINIIEKVQSSPGYLIFLESIENPKERFQIESIFRNLSSKISFFDNQYIREASHLLMRHIQRNVNKKAINDDKTYKQILMLCEMKGVFTNNDHYNKVVEEVEERTNFVDFLINRGIKEPDIKYISWEKLKKTFSKEYEKFKMKR